MCEQAANPCITHTRQAEGLTPVGDVVLNQYHPPFTYGWQRVNEVLFNVKE